MKHMKWIFIAMMTCILNIANADVSNQYTDPAQKVQPSELGQLSYEEARNIVLDIHSRINDIRAQNGKAPYAINERINWWSQQHSEWMAAGRYPLGHTGAQDRYDALFQELPQIDGGAENVASVPAGFVQPAEEVVRAWMGSTGHRFNILADYKVVGYGLAKQLGTGTWYITNFFLWSGDDQFVSEALATAPDWNPYHVTPGQDDPLVQLKSEVFNQFNEIRAQNAVPALKESTLLDQLMQQHTDAIAQGQYPLGDTDFDVRWRAIRDGLPKISRVIEWYASVPADHPNPSQEAVNQWISDLGKFGELVFTYNAFGCGVSKGEDGNYYYSVSLVQTTHPDFVTR